MFSISWNSRLKSQHENELREMEQNERKSRDRYAETRSKLAQVEAELKNLHATVNQMEIQLAHSQKVSWFLWFLPISNQQRVSCYVSLLRTFDLTQNTKNCTNNSGKSKREHCCGTTFAVKLLIFGDFFERLKAETARLRPITCYCLCIDDPCDCIFPFHSSRRICPNWYYLCLKVPEPLHHLIYEIKPDNRSNSRVTLFHFATLCAAIFF